MKLSTDLSRLARLIVLLASASFASFAAETAATPAENANKGATSYVLFTGCDIQIEHLRSLHQVRDVEGGSFVIRINNNQKLAIPMDRNPEKVKVARSLVIADRAATVTNYKYERVYTPANDPQRKFDEQMRGLAALTDSVANAERIARATPKTVTTMPTSDAPMGKEVSNPNYDANQHAATLANSHISGSMDQSFYTQQLGTELAAERFDAVEVQFYVSSAKPIQKPYVVVTARYHEKDDAKHARNWLFAKALEPIDAEPRKVYLREGGFPPGFEVESLQVHLYERGTEIPTDLSENRAPLTRDEAHEYLVIEHMNAHKADTIPTQIVLTKIPADWDTHPKDSSFLRSYYVKVDHMGQPVGAFEDETCQTNISNSYYDAVLRDQRFLPALEKGRPVDSVVKISLTKLSQ